ncbi:MAG: right-handed parallel beta-helix repeat-containing protein, partial [Candidatus Cloacimonetes bacterium]|nr:right-handed parallel beta-helix repeat-containing protein [Candidatus Cloacimonadota bacterium]
MISNRFRGNVALGDTTNVAWDWIPGGGAILMRGAGDRQITMLSNAIFENVATQNGGGLYLFSCEDSLLCINNTIADNSASLGGGLYAYESNSAFFNNLIWDNSASSQTGNQMYFDGDASATFTNCILEDGWDDVAITGTDDCDTLSIIDADPKLTYDSTDPYTFWRTSPCINQA